MCPILDGLMVSTFSANIYFSHSLEMFFCNSSSEFWVNLYSFLIFTQMRSLMWSLHVKSMLLQVLKAALSCWHVLFASQRMNLYPRFPAALPHSHHLTLPTHWHSRWPLTVRKQAWIYQQRRWWKGQRP